MSTRHKIQKISDINQVKEWLFEVINERDNLKLQIESQEELKTKIHDLQDTLYDFRRRLTESQQDFADYKGNLYGTHERRVQAINKLSPYIYDGLKVAINDDIKRGNQNLDWSRLREYNSKEFLVGLCKRGIVEDNNRFFINFENNSNDNSSNISNNENDASLFVRLIAIIMHLSIGVKELNNNANTIAHTLSLLGGHINNKWKWDFGIIMSYYMKCISSSSMVTDTVCKFGTNVNSKWLERKLKVQTDELYSNNDNISRIAAGHDVILIADNVAQYKWKTARGGIESDSSIPVVTNSIVYHIKKPEHARNVQYDINLRPDNWTSQNQQKGYYAPSLTPTRTRGTTK